MHAVSVLEDGGYEVVEAANAKQALILLDSRPDVGTVFTDINMPGTMDGCALAYAAIALRPDIRLVVTSGNGTPDKGMCPDDAAFMPKPYSAERLPLWRIDNGSNLDGLDYGASFIEDFNVSAICGASGLYVFKGEIAGSKARLKLCGREIA